MGSTGGSQDTVTAMFQPLNAFSMLGGPSNEGPRSTLTDTKPDKRSLKRPQTVSPIDVSKVQHVPVPSRIGPMSLIFYKFTSYTIKHTYNNSHVSKHCIYT